MPTPLATPCPGELTTSNALLRLADQYRAAAQLIETQGRSGDPVSRAPYRLNAIHAIELYLNALLLHSGHDPADIRGLQHDFAARAALASGCGLRLRLRTRAHLKALAVTREYVISRYDPQATTALSPLNRLSATLEEVAAKVVAKVTPDQRDRALEAKR